MSFKQLPAASHGWQAAMQIQEPLSLLFKGMLDVASRQQNKYISTPVDFLHFFFPLHFPNTHPWPDQLPTACSTRPPQQAKGAWPQHFSSLLSRNFKKPLHMQQTFSPNSPCPELLQPSCNQSSRTKFLFTKKMIFTENHVSISGFYSAGLVWFPFLVTAPTWSSKGHPGPAAFPGFSSDHRRHHKSFPYIIIALLALPNLLTFAEAAFDHRKQHS